ncbi:hypothetical protein GGI25_001952 [Coemansia spiralis]|uniref:Biogenesis of lysosome-related organelles complex 1 subunit 7 n=2 Tax=Coemansia TaxID=4863 RepID=A0A9W8G8Z5_9FUNG|nr:hypothetical protein BX070DRAFT_252517 [Coemansia spiralis]KAJ1993383.1 hypothetical protein EDC05_002247 [Coemansia umbellata]KAJ2623467.1 hypothetical protein GGI26_002306 [Coemansia sp. RSA 1358]KAJ2678963.1 hypothetical protein GGI25_001952 [Coemansia spiralis]
MSFDKQESPTSDGGKDNDRVRVDSTDTQMAALVNAQLNLEEPKDDAAKEGLTGISPNAASMLRVLLPSLTKLDGLLETVWAKQDALNEVLNRLATELEQFDELTVPPGAPPQGLSTSGAMSGGLASDKTAATAISASQQAAQKLKDSRTRVANINAILKKVRARLDSVSMLAQAKILQSQGQQQQLPLYPH